MFSYIVFSTIAVGLIGVLGAYGVIGLLAKNRERIILLVSLAAGSMIAVSFFDLLPEALTSHGDLMTIFEFLVLGFIIFLLIEKTVLFYHCHEENCQIHSTTKLVILGDAVHNFLDGVAIAASFLVSAKLGFFTTLAIILHEIPHEIGTLGVLMHNGYSKLKAMVYNLFLALTGILGGILAYFALNIFTNLLPYLLALTAGGFLYIAATDLLPEIHKEGKTKFKISLHSLFFVLGVVIMWLFNKFIRE